MLFMAFLLALRQSYSLTSFDLYVGSFEWLGNVYGYEGGGIMIRCIFQNQLVSPQAMNPLLL